MMRLILLALGLALALVFTAPLYATPIDQPTLEAVYAIALDSGVPWSVGRQLMIEESGDRRTGALGSATAVSRIAVRGYHSRGLYQLYEEPGNLSWLIANHWSGDPRAFDILDPRHNATVGLRYLAALHERFGSWYLAACYYNCGRVKDVPEETMAYARRIVIAKEILP